MSRLALPVLAALSMAAGACAPVSEGTGGSPASTATSARPCFSQSQVTNFRESADERIYLRLLNRDVVELETSGCDLALANGIQIVQDRGGSGRLCTGDAVRILNDGSDLVNIPCRARITRTLTPAEVDALPSRDQP